MHAVGRRIDMGRQRLGVGRTQFGDLPPVENLAWQFMALFGQFLKRAGTRRPLAGSGFGAAGQPQLAEQDFADLLGRARIERLPGKLPDFLLQARLLLREFTGQP